MRKRVLFFVLGPLAAVCGAAFFFLVEQVGSYAPVGHLNVASQVTEQGRYTQAETVTIGMPSTTATAPKDSNAASKQGKSEQKTAPPKKDTSAAAGKDAAKAGQSVSVDSAPRQPIVQAAPVKPDSRPTWMFDEPGSWDEYVCFGAPMSPNPKFALDCIIAEAARVGQMLKAAQSGDSLLPEVELLEYKKELEAMRVVATEEYEFASKIAFVVRTGVNVIQKRAFGSRISWASRVMHIHYASDAPSPDGFMMKGLTLYHYPAATDGVMKYAERANIMEDPSIKSGNPWDKDFVKHFGAPGELYAKLKHDPKIKWWMMVDDDTYPLLPQLRRVVNNYDEKREIWIGWCFGFGKGANGCDAYERQDEQRVQWYASGGNGMVWSRPAMEKLDKSLDKCLVTYQGCWAGDRRLGACMYDLDIECRMDKMDDGGYFLTQEYDRVVEHNSRDPTCFYYSLHKVTPFHSQFVNFFEHHVNVEPFGWGPHSTLDYVDWFPALDAGMELDSRWNVR